MPVPSRPAVDRVLDRCVAGPDGCIVWTGALTERGYGVVQMGRGIGTRKAHRVVYEAMVGPIPDGLTLDHLCANPRCCNPGHLDPCSRSENTRRQWADGRADPGRYNREKTHCIRGHEFTEENTYSEAGRRRRCRACARERARQRRSGGRAPIAERVGANPALSKLGERDAPHEEEARVV